MTDPLDGLPPLPTLGPVHRRPPPGGVHREWQRARVVEVRKETATARTFRLELPPGTPAHLPGQHYVVRVADAGAGRPGQRSFSVASAPEPGVAPDRPRHIELTVERVAGGQVSPVLHDQVVVGDEVEVRGPFGGWFVWSGLTPALLVAGGSGVVPLMSMLRHWRALGRPVPLRLVVSTRTADELFYADEYGPECTVLYTRSGPAGGAPTGRLDVDVLRPLLIPEATCYVCGSATFTRAAAQLLVDAGVDPGSIRLEGFGPS